MFDLHIHSTFSDGKDDLDTLIKNVKNAGIDYFALTDHDTALGCRTILNSEELKQKIRDNGLTFVVGVEFTCLFEGQKMHILAYDFDPFAPEVLDLEQQMSDLLKLKDVERFKFLEDAGYVFSDKSKEFLKSRVNIRKLDIANCLVDDGYFDEVEVAIQECLQKIKYPRKYRLDGKEVLEKMNKIGAKLVWAHSLHGLKEKAITHEDVDRFVAMMKPLGLAGLECFYSLYDVNEIAGLVEIANKHGLFITCGSDYHGKNKAVQLAEMSSDGSPVDESMIKVKDIFKNTIS